MINTSSNPPPTKIEICPIFFKEACKFISEHHRHHKPPTGHIFSIAAHISGKIVGVATVGRPTSRKNQDGFTAEVTRLCTDGSRNVCSKLYSSCWQAAKALGYKKLITFILDSENGASLKASNFRMINFTTGGSWNSKSRPRIDINPTQGKIKFEIS